MREQPWVNIKERGGTPFTKAHDPLGNLDLIDEKITETTAATAAAAANTTKTAMLTNATVGAGASLILAEPTGSGAFEVTIQAPALAADRAVTVPDADVNLGHIAANTLKTAMLTNATAGDGASLILAEPTGGGAFDVTLQAPALAADRTITVPDANVDLGTIATNATGISNLTDGTTARTGVITNTQNVGGAGTGVVAEEVGDGMHHITILTLTDVDLGAIGGAGNLAIGALIYTFPAGAHWYKVGYFGAGLQGDTPILADTPDVGIGSDLANGAVAVLGGTAAFEDYVDGFAAADCDGTLHDLGPLVSTAGFGAGIALNGVGAAKTVYLNAACNWAGASPTLLASGTIVLVWDTLA